ncbi:hypothetical protein DFJ74DRAFT_672178 [Hyaloraphidium curvatum]|nr:hypothetical protein DFJ74DRAFT_672178 [Hyaloraphidium curvatum]
MPSTAQEGSTAAERVEKAFPSICNDYSYFKATLKSLRALDDSVVVKLNSLRGQPRDAERNADSCQLFRKELLASYAARTDILDYCIPLAEAQLAQLDRSAGLEQRKTLELLISERTVEEIVRERTADVFKAKCRPLALVEDRKPP